MSKGKITKIAAVAFAIALACGSGAFGQYQDQDRRLDAVAQRHLHQARHQRDERPGEGARRHPDYPRRRGGRPRSRWPRSRTSSRSKYDVIIINPMSMEGCAPAIDAANAAKGADLHAGLHRVEPGQGPHLRRLPTRPSPARYPGTDDSARRQG